MKPALEICAELRQRDLYDLCETEARRHGVKLADVCSGARGSDIVEARHAIWRRLSIFFGGNASAVARVFGADHTTILYALEDEPPAILSVVLAKFETESAAYHFVWFSGRVNPFGVTDRVAAQTTWFPSYEQARDVFSECCERAGAPTFRSHAQQTGGAR